MRTRVQALQDAHTHYRKRRSTFLNIWATISEGMEGKESDLFDEIGVENDASVG